MPGERFKATGKSNPSWQTERRTRRLIIGGLVFGLLLLVGLGSYTVIRYIDLGARLEEPSDKVDIEGGKETSIEIGITKSAHLTVKVMVYGFAKEDSLQKEYAVHKGKDKAVPKDTETDLVEEHGLANVLLVLKSELESLGVLTDRKGRVSFHDVRPGHWTLTVHADNLPEYHYLEKDTFKIELRPGEKKEILVRVLPRKRTIRIIEEGKTLIEEKK